ncbi:hypothetical protein C7E17_26870, partial [Stenotrophomonas maltophilia]
IDNRKVADTVNVTTNSAALTVPMVVRAWPPRAIWNRLIPQHQHANGHQHPALLHPLDQDRRHRRGHHAADQ